MVIVTLSLGGLAYSIGENIESIAFPVIVGSALIMAYAGFVQEVGAGPDHA
jgi:hypothetical protein